MGTLGKIFSWQIGAGIWAVNSILDVSSGDYRTAAVEAWVACLSLLIAYFYEPSRTSEEVR